MRYTAPSLYFTNDDGRSLEAGGFQPLEAYDVVIANLDPTLARRPPAEDPVEVLAAFEHPLATAEVVATMTPHLGVPDLVGVEPAHRGGRRRSRAADPRRQQRPLGARTLAPDAAIGVSDSGRRIAQPTQAAPARTMTATRLASNFESPASSVAMRIVPPQSTSGPKPVESLPTIA